MKSTKVNKGHYRVIVDGDTYDVCLDFDKWQVFCNGEWISDAKSKQQAMLLVERMIG